MSSPKIFWIILKTWLSCILLGPLVYILLSCFQLSGIDNLGDAVENMLPAWVILLPIGALFSLPAMVLLGLGLRWLAGKSSKKTTLLLYALALGGLLMLSTFFITFYYLDEPKDLNMMAGYLTAVWLGIFWAFWRPGEDTASELARTLDEHL